MGKNINSDYYNQEHIPNLIPENPQRRTFGDRAKNKTRNLALLIFIGTCIRKLLCPQFCALVFNIDIKSVADYSLAGQLKFYAICGIPSAFCFSGRNEVAEHK